MSPLNFLTFTQTRLHDIAQIRYPSIDLNKVSALLSVIKAKHGIYRIYITIPVLLSQLTCKNQNLVTNRQIL